MKNNTKITDTPFAVFLKLCLYVLVIEEKDPCWLGISKCNTLCQSKNDEILEMLLFRSFYAHISFRPTNACEQRIFFKFIINLSFSFEYISQLCQNEIAFEYLLM